METLQEVSGMAKRLEAIEIKVVPKGESVNRGGNAYYSKEQMLDTEQTVIDEEQPGEEIGTRARK